MHSVSTEELDEQRLIVEEEPLSPQRLDIISKHIERIMGYEV